jgi:hypothetical protein
MAQSVPVKLELSPELRDALDRIRRDLAPVIDAAGELMTTATDLLDFIPPEVSPVVVTRDRLAELQAAVDNFRNAAQAYLEERPRA